MDRKPNTVSYYELLGNECFDSQSHFLARGEPPSVPRGHQKGVHIMVYFRRLHESNQVPCHGVEAPSR